MKKIIGLTIALTSLVAVSSLTNVNALAEEPAKASNFKNETTKSKLKFTYNPTTLETSKVQVKFGGPIKVENFNNDAEHGVIVVPGQEANSLKGTDSLLDIEAFNALNNKKYVKKFDNSKIANVNIDGLGDCKQYAWVLDTTMSYEYTFAATMYEKLGDVVTVTAPAIRSVASLVTDYSLSDKVDDNIKNVLAKYAKAKEANVDIEISRDLVYNSITEGNYPEDNNYELFAYAWNNINKEQAFSKCIYNQETNSYKFSTLNSKDQILFLLMPKDSTDGSFETKLAKTKNLRIINGNVVDPNEEVVIRNINSKLSGRISYENGANPAGKPLYAWVWSYGAQGHFVKVNNDTLITTSDMNLVKFVYMKEDKPTWGENGSNIILESPELPLKNDEAGFYRRYKIEYDNIRTNIKWDQLDLTAHDLWARCWDSKDASHDYWYKVDYETIETSSKYDSVIFVVKPKGSSYGFDGKEAESRTYTFNANGVNW